MPPVANGDMPPVVEGAEQAQAGTSDAGGAVPTAAGFNDLLGGRLIGKSGDVEVDVLKGKIVGLYFSANGCPPQLVEQYKKLQAKGKDFEIVFVSGGKDEASFRKNYDGMPWLALPFEDSEHKDKLTQKFEVPVIPTLCTDMRMVMCSYTCV